MASTSLMQPKAKESLADYHRRIIDTYKAQAKIAPSRIKNAGNGVFAPCATPAGVTLGFYAGRQITHDQAEKNPSAYILSVAKNTNLERCGVIPLSNPDSDPRKSILIDASDRSVANWCSMVNDYRDSGKNPNVQFKRNGALVTITPLRKGEELLLDYGVEYWKAMSKCSQLQTKYSTPATCDDGTCAMKSSGEQQQQPSTQQQTPVPRKRKVAVQQQQQPIPQPPKRPRKAVQTVKVSQTVPVKRAKKVEFSDQQQQQPPQQQPVKRALKVKAPIAKKTTYAITPPVKQRKTPIKQQQPQTSSLFDWQ